MVGSHGLGKKQQKTTEMNEETRAIIAAAALQGLLAAKAPQIPNIPPEDAAHRSVAYADALISELDKTRKNDVPF